MLLDEFPRPMLFAHRGASAYAPENTIAAFELAVRQFKDQIPAIELDVQLSADQQVIVIHDETVNRTTNGRGRVNRLNLTQLKELDAGSFFNTQFKGEQIPTLGEVFEAVGKQAYINVELANYASPLDQLSRYVAEIVKKHNMIQRVMFSSFLPLNLNWIQHWLPEAICGYLLHAGELRKWKHNLPLGLIPHQAVHPHIKDVTAKRIAAVHNSGRRVNVWTVNTPEVIKRLAHWGADGIFTDDLIAAQEALAGLQAKP